MKMQLVSIVTGRCVISTALLYMQEHYTGYSRAVCLAVSLSVRSFITWWYCQMCGCIAMQDWCWGKPAVQGWPCCIVSEMFSVKNWDMHVRPTDVWHQMLPRHTSAEGCRNVLRRRLNVLMDGASLTHSGMAFQLYVHMSFFSKQSYFHDSVRLTTDM